MIKRLKVNAAVTGLHVVMFFCMRGGLYGILGNHDAFFGEYRQRFAIPGVLSVGIQMIQVGCHRSRAHRQYIFYNFALAVGFRLPLYRFNRASGAFADAGAKAVAQAFAHHAGFAVNDAESAFGAALGAQAAAVAQRLVDLDYRSSAHGFLLVKKNQFNG